jgi:hypothetical protein
VCQEFGLLYSTIQNMWKNGTNIISELERNRSRIKQFRESERSDVDEALLKWFKQRRSDDVPVSGPPTLITFFFLNFNFKLMHFLEYTCTKIDKNRKVTFVIPTFQL